MQPTLRERLGAAPLPVTLAVGALALALSLTLSQYLNRDLLGEIAASSRVPEPQQTVAPAHESAPAALLAVVRARAEGRAPDDAAAGFAASLSRLDAALDGDSVVPAHAVWRDARPRLQAVAAGVPEAVLLDAQDHLARVGRALRTHADNERLAHQGAMIRLRSRTVALTYLMCLLFTLTAMAATHGVLLARRERHARREAVAARREAEAAGEQAQAAGRDKSRFLGMLSHELLTPLQSIISSMDIIESRGRVEAGEPLFLRLRESARSLRARLSDLVDFAKMTAGSLAISPRRFRFDRLVEDVIADHEEAVLRKDLDIHWEPGADLQRPLTTDPRRVRQILDNLVSNAIKYTERGGVTIEAACDVTGTRLDLEVRDTGIGIAPDLLARIFDPFYRVPASAGMADGSGLGLAVVRSLVDLLHGEIRVESTPGTGTRVGVPLPLPPPGPPDPAPPPTDPRPRVLVVDDAHDVRTAVADVLRAIGYAPAEAGSGGEALRALAERPFAAVLLDLELPDVRGDEIARQLREGHGPNRHARLVLLSAAHDAPAGLERWFDARADKPVSAEHLRATLAPLAAGARGTGG